MLSAVAGFLKLGRGDPVNGDRRSGDRRAAARPLSNGRRRVRRVQTRAAAQRHPRRLRHRRPGIRCGAPVVDRHSPDARPGDGLLGFDRAAGAPGSHGRGVDLLPAQAQQLAGGCGSGVDTGLCRAGQALAAGRAAALRPGHHPAGHGFRAGNRPSGRRRRPLDQPSRRQPAADRADEAVRDPLRGRLCHPQAGADAPAQARLHPDGAWRSPWSAS